MKIDEEYREKAEKAVDLIEDDLPIMALTGAGISVESSIPPFRGPGGLWERYDPYEHGHIEMFRKHPERSWTMLREIIDGALDSRPNEAHLALARMEKEGWVSPLITQNVDGLHLLAGTGSILEVHGNARRMYCMGCGNRETIDQDNWGEFSIMCECGSVKRPDIVFFGEQLPERELDEVFRLAYSGRSLLVVGTSGLVHPVAMVPALVSAQGGRVIEINPEPSEFTGSVSDVRISAAATVGMSALEEAFRNRFS